MKDIQRIELTLVLAGDEKVSGYAQISRLHEKLGENMPDVWSYELQKLLRDMIRSYEHRQADGAAAQPEPPTAGVLTAPTRGRPLIF